jgi:hypothetical protein
MEFNNKLYYVLPSDMAQQLDYNSLESSSYEEVRKSIDGTLCIVEYKGTLPVNSGSFLTHQQALELMATPEWWSEPDETLM